MPSFRPVVRSGDWFHVMNRGADDATLFARPEDAASFVASLGEASANLPVDIHAFCAMGSHYHLLARAEEADLLLAVATLDAGLAGPAGRVRLRRMALGRHLLQVTRYIHRNPVEAGLVARPEDWPWSSYRGYLDRLQCPPWLRTEAVLGWLGSYGPRQRYRRYVEATHPPLGSLRERPEPGRFLYGSITEPEGGAIAMASLTLKGLPDELLARLREVAEANRRSLNREVIERLARSVETRPFDADAFLADADAIRKRLDLRPLTDDAIRKAKRAGRS